MVWVVRSVGVGKEEEEEWLLETKNDFLSDFWGDKKNTIRSKKNHHISSRSLKPNQFPPLSRRPLPPSHPRLSPCSACPLARSLLHSVLSRPIPLARTHARLHSLQPPLDGDARQKG